jgi:hypothetical protein
VNGTIVSGAISPVDSKDVTAAWDSLRKAKAPYLTRPVPLLPDQLRSSAGTALARGDWSGAARALSTLLDGSEAASPMEAQDKQALLDRTFAYAKAGRPFAALQDLDRLFIQARGVKELQPLIESLLLERGVLHLDPGDEEGYRLLCADAVERAKKPKGADSAAVLRLCVLAPGGLPTEPGALDRLASAAETEATGSDFRRREARLGRIGLSYRMGRYEETIRLSEVAAGDASTRSPADRAWGALFGAMALANLGRSEAAHARLAIADALMVRIPSGRVGWAERWAADILRREAVRTLATGQRMATAQTISGVVAFGNRSSGNGNRRRSLND